MTKNKKHTEENCCHENLFPSHKKELPRLNRAIGQIEGVKKMIENNRYCPDILIQLKAIRSAVKSVENNILKSHLENCVADTFNNKEESQKKIMEIKDLLNRFDS